MILAQLRHVRAAERSAEAPIEHEQHVHPAAHVGKPERHPPEVLECEIGRYIT
jgi:hypothetical protein